MKLCECGCGQPAPIAQQTTTRLGYVKGQPKRFVNGHNNGAKATPLEQRLKHVEVEAGYQTPCWRGTWTPHPAGYCRVKDRGKLRMAHVVTYERAYGPVPAGHEVDHLCQNRWCINPKHLEAVTRAVNTQRGRTAKLTPVTVLAIRFSDESDNALARRYGVSNFAIKECRDGRTWRNVGGPIRESA
jgi:hypothetical protein